MALRPSLLLEALRIPRILGVRGLHLEAMRPAKSSALLAARTAPAPLWHRSLQLGRSSRHSTAASLAARSGFTRLWQRNLCTSGRLGESKEEERLQRKQAKLEQSLAAREKQASFMLRVAMKYGRTGVAVYVALDVAALLGIYAALHHGVDAVAIFHNLGLNIEDYLPEEASTFVLAYVLNHLTGPARMGLTAIITPRLAPILRARYPRWF
eukprot:m.48684 g.48684  ORF g.48684 m.48684 type:complete len:211 (+) comp6438_c0_seq2:1565-2197(+)